MTMMLSPVAAAGGGATSSISSPAHHGTPQRLLTTTSSSSWPVPVCITMYNLMHNSSNNNAKDGVEEKRTWFRPEYDSSLLTPTRLDVYLSKKEGAEASSSAGETDEKEEVLLYSCKGQGSVIHPEWDLLNERMQLSGLQQDGKEEEFILKDEQYESTRARIVVVVSGSSDNGGDEVAAGTPPRDWVEREEKVGKDGENMPTRAEIEDGEKDMKTSDGGTLLHESRPKQHEPRLLKGEGVANTHGTDLSVKEGKDGSKLEGEEKEVTTISGDDAVLESSRTKEEQVQVIVLADFALHPKRLRRIPNSALANNLDGASSNNMKTGPPLKALPPNAVLVKYSDGSTRITSELYNVLVNQDVLSEQDHHDSSSSLDYASSPSRVPRFDDDVFNTLDKAVSTPQRASPSALLGIANNDDLQIPIDTATTTSTSSLPPPKITTSTSPKNSHLELPELERTTSLLDSDDVVESQVMCSLPTEIEATIASLEQQRNELEQHLQQEEQKLQDELQLLQQTDSDLKAIKDETRVAQEETKDILEETQNETNRGAKAEFQLEAQRIKLLTDLRTIYPIECKDSTFKICGCQLPSLDVYYSAAVSEDEVSAAMGYLVHLVTMVSKYLEIPLRYRLVCNSSRSAIQEDSRKMHPLFVARMVDRTQLDRGLVLLNRNVDCLLLSRNVPVDKKSHVLVKMKRLYDNIIDGA